MLRKSLTAHLAQKALFSSSENLTKQWLIFTLQLLVCSEMNASKSIVLYKQTINYQAFVPFYIQPVFTKDTDLPLVDTLYTPCFVQIK